MQAQLFDAAEARRLKREGMERVQALSEAQEWLRKAREQAYVWARTWGYVTSDDVLGGVPHPAEWGLSPNLIGVIFKEACWEPTGEDTYSQRPSTHGRRIRKWRLKPIDTATGQG